MTVHVTIELDEDVKANLDAEAATRGLDVSALVSEALRYSARAKARYVEMVEEGRAAVREGRVHSQEEVEARMVKLRAAVKAQLGE